MQFFKQICLGEIDSLVDFLGCMCTNKVALKSRNPLMAHSNCSMLYHLDYLVHQRQFGSWSFISWWVKFIQICFSQIKHDKRRILIVFCEFTQCTVLWPICRHQYFLPRELHLHESHFNKKPYFYHYYLPYKVPI